MLVLSKQKYGRSETPVFLAFLDDPNGNPVNPNDYSSLTMTHGVVRQTFNGKRTDPLAGLEEIAVPKSQLLAAPVDSPIAFEGTATIPFDYNFIFLPGNLGVDFYPSYGTYRTLFELHRVDGSTESMTFESECIRQFSGATINFGERPVFSGTIRTKTIAGDYSAGVAENQVASISKTVFSDDTGEIVSDELIPLSCLTAGAEDNFLFEPASNMFPSVGCYTIRFTFRHVDGSPVGVVDVPIGVI